MPELSFGHLFFRFKFTPVTVRKRLEAITWERPTGYWFGLPPKGKFFQGSLLPRSFRLQNLGGSGGKNVWVPTFCGTIRTSALGSEIDVAVCLKGIDYIVWLLYHLLYLSIAFASLWSTPLVGLIILVVCGAVDSLGYYMGFVQGKQYFRAYVEQALEE